MALKEYPLCGGTEWATDPTHYRTDPEAYREEVEKAVKLLEGSGFSYMFKFWAGGPKGAALLEEERTGEFFEFSDPSDVRWQGPELKVYDDGSFQLLFHPKHSYEEMWVDLRLEAK